MEFWASQILREYAIKMEMWRDCRYEQYHRWNTYHRNPKKLDSVHHNVIIVKPLCVKVSYVILLTNFIIL
jgi:hypothetical protein